MKMLNAMDKEQFLSLQGGTVCHVADFQLGKPIEVLLYISDSDWPKLWALATIQNQYIHLRSSEGRPELAAFRKETLFDLIKSKNYTIYVNPVPNQYRRVYEHEGQDN